MLGRRAAQTSVNDPRWKDLAAPSVEDWSVGGLTVGGVWLTVIDEGGSSRLKKVCEPGVRPCPAVSAKSTVFREP